jgi:hypothetical protein
MNGDSGEKTQQTGQHQFQAEVAELLTLTRSRHRGL